MMRSRCLLGFVPVVMVVLLLAACGETVDESADTTLAVMTTETADTTVASTTTITLQETTTTLVAPTTTWVVDEVLPEAAAVGLAEPGEYGVGEREYTFVDPTRQGREVVVSVHYPAVADGSFVVSDAEPNVSAAPYPVVVGSDQMANLMGPHLASHGFIVLGGVGQATWDDHPSWKMVDYPLDLMIGLDGLEDLDEGDPLAGIAATDRAGVIDYSFGSWTALMLAGGRVNPTHYDLDMCVPSRRVDRRMVCSMCAARPMGGPRWSSAVSKRGLPPPRGCGNRWGTTASKQRCRWGPRDSTSPAPMAWPESRSR